MPSSAKATAPLVNAVSSRILLQPALVMIGVGATAFLPLGGWLTAAIGLAVVVAFLALLLWRDL